jgi:diguanylate cyclase (GGDEF)-like protein
MLSVRIPPQGTSAATPLVDGTWLALFIGATMLFIMALGVVAAMLDRRLDRQTARLVESLRSANARLKHSSNHDALTGLPNRPAVYAGIEAALARAARTGSRCALLYIDLDGFKLINDSLGHTIGDRLLMRAGGVMQSACEAHHLLGRIGGDEFLLLVEQVTDDDDMERLCGQIMHRLSGISERGAALSASIGIATYPADAENTATLVSAADMAMYEAKRAGKRRVQRYLASMGVLLAESFQIQSELRTALDNDELTVYYQPKYAARDNRLTGAEALVRWQHPERGLVLPGVFIEIAERSGLINELELRVIAIVCRQIREWRDAGYEVAPISINLSVVHLLDDGLTDQITARLREYDVPARYLVFEITETLAMQEFDTTIRVLRQLNALGINIALDDFGTGYSSLSYLQRLPIQQLKIDRSFVADITDKSSDRSAIVKRIIDLSHVLEITVVGEGVETEEQRLYLQQIGCDELQGFLLGRPMPGVDFARRLPKRARKSGADGHSAVMRQILPPLI